MAAVALFAQRAVEVEPDFALTAANAAAVAAICIDVEGVPLAIELAAAKLKLFSPPALLAQLKQRLALLTGGPHDMPGGSALCATKLPGAMNYCHNLRKCSFDA